MSEISIKQVLIDFIKENKASICGYLFFSLATPLSNIYLPHLYGQIISVINAKGSIDREVRIRFACIFILWVLVQMFWAAMNVIDSKFIPNLRSHVRKYIVETVLETYREDYTEEELGGIMSEIVRLPDEVEHLFRNVRNHILPMTFLLTFSIGYFTWTNPRLGAASIVAIGLYLTIAVSFSKKCIPIWKEMHNSHRHLHGEISDCLGNLLNIYTANQDQSELNRLDEYEQEFLEQNRRTIRCVGNFRLLLNLSYIFLFCSINILSFYLFSRHLIELDSVVSVLIISLELISKMAGFVGSIDRIMYELSTIQNVQEALDLLAKRRVKQPENKTVVNERPTLDGDINIEKLQLQYDNTPILKDITMHIPKGVTVVIIGEIGSGKTSLINSIIRLIPFTGQITVNGYDIKNVDLGYLRENILYVPQNPRLFNRTIYENIAYGSNVSKDQVNNILEYYGINIDIDRHVGKYGQSLSGGQRQIVYLLRCLFKNAPIVLLDEPTASLDTDTKEHILKILADLLIERTVFIISHDRDVIKYANMVVELDKGRIKRIDGL